VPSGDGRRGGGGGLSDQRGGTMSLAEQLADVDSEIQRLRDEQDDPYIRRDKFAANLKKLDAQFCPV